MNRCPHFCACCPKRRATIGMAEALSVKVNGLSALPADADAQRRLLKALRRQRLSEFLALLQEAVDVDRAHDQEQTTLLMLACAKPGLHEFAAALLAAGADPNARDSVGRTALHYAAFQSHEEALRLLLGDARTDVRAVDKEGSTALHYMASPSWTILDTEPHLRCIAMLMDHPHFEVNRPDGIGQTAITTAVLLYYDERIQVMLEHGRERLNLDCSRVTNGKSVREMIRKRFPALVRFLPPRRLESLASPDPHVQLLAALQHRDLPVFSALLHHDAVDPNNWYDDPYYCTCLELACRQLRAEKFVAALIEAGADPNTSNRIYGVPVVHQATENANHPALAVLIHQGRARLDVTDRSKHTALHVAAQKQCASQEELEDIQRCISLLLEHDEAAAETLSRANWYDAVDAALRPRIDIDAQDEFGDTALHDAAHYGNQQVVLALLRRGANVMKKNQDGDPPLAFIDAKTLDQFLDEQIKSNGLSPLSQDYQVIIRYTFLEPSTEKATGRSEMDALHYISRSRDLRPLLRHPVINSFLNLKWYMVRWFFYINLIVYTLFVTLITAYILLINVDDEDVTNCTMINFTRNEPSAKIMDVVDPEKSSLVLNLECKEFDENCTKNYVRQLSLSDVDKFQVGSLVKAVFGSKKRCVHQHDDPKHLSVEEFAAHCLRIPCLYLLIALFLREIVQCATSWKRYAQDWENIIEFLMIIVCAIALSSDWDASNFKQHISAMAILLTWTELVFMTGRLPFLSVQLEMLKKVSFTFLRFMAWYSLLVVAFALSFYTLFRRSKEYDPESKEAFFLDPGLSVIKTIIMMVGEFEASELVFDSVPGTSHVVFIIFVFLIAIILLNLLNGLAVYDTQAIKEDAVVLGLVSMVKLVAYLEMMLIKIAEATQCMYKGVYREVLEPRIRLFRTHLSKKQIHAFPNSGEIKFLLDAATTARFKGFRMERDIMVKATDIVTEKRQVSDIEQVKRRLNKYQIKFEEIESKQSKTHELLIEALETLSKVQKTVRESTI